MNTLKLTRDREGVFGVNDEGRTTITFKRSLNHPIDRVWLAITDAGELAQWLPMLKTLELKEGGDVILDFSGGDCPPDELNPEDIDHCKVVTFDPPHLIEYIGPTGGLRFELNPRGDQSELTMTATNHPDRGIIYSIVCGWHYYADCLVWQLDGVPFNNEGHMDKTTTKIYQYYIDEKVPGFEG